MLPARAGVGGSSRGAAGGERSVRRHRRGGGSHGVGSAPRWPKLQGSPAELVTTSGRHRLAPTARGSLWALWRRCGEHAWRCFGTPSVRLRPAPSPVAVAQPADPGEPPSRVPILAVGAGRRRPPVQQRLWPPEQPDAGAGRPRGDRVSCYARPPVRRARVRSIRARSASPSRAHSRIASSSRLHSSARSRS